MKGFYFYCSMFVWALILTVSCGSHGPCSAGFVNEPQDSISIDLKYIVFPASEIRAVDARKCGGYYFFWFYEKNQRGGDVSSDILLAVSEDKFHVRHLPLPESMSHVSSFFTRNDTLVVGLANKHHYSFSLQKWEWEAFSRIDDGTLFEDEDWIVMHSDQGEFGDATWFIDKHAREEYAFVGLSGSIRRINSTFFIVNRSRIYKLDDPTIGFHCDSTTRYENAKDIRLIAAHFWREGYSPLNHTFSPIVHLDDESPEIEEYKLGDMTLRHGGFGLTYYAKADTVIEGSFIASDRLYCLLNTPAGLELVKLDDDRFVSVHRFNKDAGDRHLRYRFPGTYPSITSVYKYKDQPDSRDERLLLLLNAEAGTSELIDIAYNGNSLLKVCYDPGGLHPVRQDGFKELLSAYLENWGALSLGEVLEEENHFGGIVSYRYINERYDISSYIVSKQIDNSYRVDTNYRIRESDQSVQYVYIDWRSEDYNSGFVPVHKYGELEGIITDLVGTGTRFPQTKDTMKYTEWHSGPATLKLYGGDYQVRFSML